MSCNTITIKKKLIRPAIIETLISDPSNFLLNDFLKSLFERILYFSCNPTTFIIYRCLQLSVTVTNRCISFHSVYR